MRYAKSSHIDNEYPGFQNVPTFGKILPMQKTFTEAGIYRILLLAVTLLLIWKWHCASPSCPPIVERVHTDTFWRQRPDSSAWTSPQPVSVKPGKPPSRKPILRPVEGSNVPDTFWMPVDTAAILLAYYDVSDYDTTYQFAEGEIKVQNSVTENRLATQRVLPTFNIPEITTTVTQAEKKRGQVYLGIDGYGGQQIPLFGAGASVMYKTKKDKVYEFGPVIFKDQPIMFKGGFKFLLSFRK